MREGGKGDMSDLISRKALALILRALEVELIAEKKEAIENDDLEVVLAIDNQLNAFWMARCEVSKQPTAYDVDKVVEKLEIIRENRQNDAERSLHNGNEFMEYGYNCEISGIDKAIYMIEKGGNNE